eukprot:SAG11_NODE_8007_length_1071_cov_0.887860_1_plen_191_part_00
MTRVLCLAAEGRCALEGITYLEHPLVETHCTLQEGGEQLAELVPTSVAFVAAALGSGSRVLIHCLHGRTRSAAIATCIRAALLKEDFGTAYRVVQACRDVHVPKEWHPRLAAAVLSCNGPPSAQVPPPAHDSSNLSPFLPPGTREYLNLYPFIARPISFDIASYQQTFADHTRLSTYCSSISSGFVGRPP